ncbi:MAG: hypothetical protein ACI3VN_04990 [Candidatus Onthomonas sp.]
MRHNRNFIWICSDALVLVFLLTLMILPKIRPSAESKYSRKVEEDFFSLGMEQLNCTIAEPFSLQEGDTIDVSIVHLSGELLLSIGQENQEPIYTGRNPELGSFQVTIPEDGNYLISASGKHAEGSVSFQINRAVAES